jgi:hypothetical protein
MPARMGEHGRPIVGDVLVQQDAEANPAGCAPSRSRRSVLARPAKALPTKAAIDHIRARHGAHDDAVLGYFILAVALLLDPAAVSLLLAADTVLTAKA